ncbi:substrate-binding periplasmic protein [Massilia phyllosphaerae]|uniref:substrate-binding periplasmic protein n=1 Tax=Massilia phyllosphaerae TaxID=3106034 RepID=UPI002B1CC991|nr:transporter substrate-binding domain-containing protein [Massilia sp. SGZ-792]
MKTKILAALLTVVLGNLTAAPAWAQTLPRLYLATEPLPYAPSEGEQAAGIATDMVRDIMRRAGIDYTIHPLPWKRAYTAALERPEACVYATTRTPERERQFKWAGPIATADWVLMARADRKFALRSLEDARPYRIGTYHGDARDQFLRARGFDVDPASNDQTNPRKLLMGRIDLWAASLGPNSRQTLARLGYTDKLVPVLVFNRIHAYLACNCAVPDRLVARMNAALDAMERDGTAGRIRRKYDVQPAQTARR